MLGAVMFGHRHFQPVIDAIIQLAEKAAKEPRDFALPDDVGDREGDARHRRAGPARGLRDPAQGGAPRRGRRRQEEGDGALLPGRRRTTRNGRCSRSPACSRSSKPRSCAGTSSTPASASTAATSKTVRPIVSEVGVLPRTHGSALFTRGETQALVVATLGTGEDEQWIDALEGTYKEALPAALQLPALLGRRDRPHGLARPPRDRPRQARLARDPSDAAGEGRVPLHDPRRLGDHRVRTARPRWRRSAAPRWR